MTIMATLGAALLLGQVGTDGPPPVIIEGPVSGCCSTCGVERSVVVAEIVRLQTCSNWRARDQAARALRRFDWHCHPEIPGALAYALLQDRDPDVRQEAAQTLTRLAPCTPVAHEALRRAAACDPDRATRRAAARGLRNLATRCDAPCLACGTVAPAAVALPGPTVTAPAIELLPATPSKQGPATEPSPGPALTPPVDSRVTPPAVPAPDDEEIAPLPPPADEPALDPIPQSRQGKPEFAGDEAPKPALKPAPSRPRIATLLPRFLRPKSAR